MSAETKEELERQMKALERDKLAEEVRRLKEGRKREWIAPSVWLALLPLVGGFGLWIVGEVKQYSKGHKAIETLKELNAEVAKLTSDQTSLNVELIRLRLMKTHYEEETNRLERESASRQEIVDKAYLRSTSANGEVRYMLGHIAQDPRFDKDFFDRLRAATSSVPKEVRPQIDEAISKLQLALVLAKESEHTLSTNQAQLNKLTVSPWARQLQPNPRGAYGLNKALMVTKATGGEEKFYDVDEGRFLTADEVKKLKR